VEGKCPRCKGAFAFEPQAGDPVTDLAFKNAIDAVSADGRVSWGVEHLHYEICRRKRTPPMALLGCGVILGALGLVAAILALTLDRIWWLGTLAAILGLLKWVAVKSRAKLVRVDGPTFERLWERWGRAHGPPAGVIVRQPPPSRPPDVEPDLDDYSFDRAVNLRPRPHGRPAAGQQLPFREQLRRPVDRRLPSGTVPDRAGHAPAQPATASLRLARRDAGRVPPGASTRRRPEWFAGGVKVIDVGLRPTHSRTFQGLLLEAEGKPVDAEEAIAKSEARWLERYALELAAIRPEQVLKRVFRAINLPINPDHYPGPVIYLAVLTSNANARDTDSRADSFG
jgi:hypothetical protein